MSEEGRNRCFDITDLGNESGDESLQARSALALEAIDSKVSQNSVVANSDCDEGFIPPLSLDDLSLDQSVDQMADFVLAASREEIDFADTEQIKKLLTAAQKEGKLQQFIEMTNKALKEINPNLSLAFDMSRRQMGDFVFVDSTVYLIDAGDKTKIAAPAVDIHSKEILPRVPERFPPRGLFPRVGKP